MPEVNLKALSHAMSHALRHEPDAYGLQLDAGGWVPVASLLAALRARRAGWRGLERSDVERMMAAAEKQRFELDGDRIRAAYGHSVEARIVREAAAPPDPLFHGTAPDLVPAILQDGLRPMGRQQVHLSADEGTAWEVGRRKSGRPAILRVDAGAAGAAGVLFYHGGGPVWLADAVPGRFLQLVNGEPG